MAICKRMGIPGHVIDSAGLGHRLAVTFLPVLLPDEEQ